MNRKHALPGVIVIVLLKIMSHGRGSTGIALWAEPHGDAFANVDFPAQRHSLEGCLPANAVHVEAGGISSVVHRVVGRLEDSR